MRRSARLAAGLGLLAASVACASAPPPVLPGPPKYPAYSTPAVPAGLAIADAQRARHELGWQRLQSGDLRGASRDFNEVLKRVPGFYPSETGLGFVALAGGDAKAAATRFEAAIARGPSYVPALLGQIEAALSLGRDDVAVQAIESVLALEPTREDLRDRLDLLKLRGLQRAMAAGAAARRAGRLDDAQRELDRALALAPESAGVLRELAAVESARGALDAAEAHARRSLAIDAADAETHAVLAGVLEASGRFRDAADALARANDLSPRAEWRDHAASLRSRAAHENLPAEYRAIPSAQRVTRAQLAAMLGIRLEAVIARAPQKAASVVTDIRGHWAAPWILPVLRAGVMEAFSNHTFQPGVPVTRAELAETVARAAGLLGARSPSDLARWRAARPKFEDLPAAHLSYPAVAIAVTSGAMTTLEGDRFAPTRPVSGPEVVAAVARLEQLAGR